ncbi:oxaloacetate decarboxylase [Pseudoroseomonas cervicalis]|uniref:isocitrate lyase/PEP mutase family protein n=1 Tax=Teichococcus cervicalis TaxID=204525 RepID=UPI002788961E|nr:isocitrate lyase/PEP mutase family protein [Pseudoroseomonas cervicalis]MDQ1077493.1 2-methylisocitrate lyase-like PEP mutase family enzyme [Pseudoroseomonas cervicalis]
MSQARPHPAEALRAALAQGLVMAPGAPDALTARMIAQAGFPALYMTGLGANAARLGLPDLGLMSGSEMVAQARDLTRAVTIPVIADADTGYGGVLNIRRTVQDYAQAGVAALHLEDQQSPKRCGQLAGIRLVPAEEAALRLRAALAARGAEKLLVIGRTDALPAMGMAEALDRARRYQDAGVDLVFVDGVKRLAELEEIARALPGPKVVSIVDGTETVALRAEELQQMGFSLALYAVSTLFTAIRAIGETLAALRCEGSTASRAPAMASYAEFAAVVGLAEQQGWAEEFGG